MERERLKRSNEEEDTLARSTKKFKDSHRFHGTIENEKGKVNKVGSYNEEDLELDNEEDNDQDGNIRIGFSKEEKIRYPRPTRTRQTAQNPDYLHLKPPDQSSVSVGRGSLTQGPEPIDSSCRLAV
nr:hypothetical protein CFP56_77390 [Quercus suber]